MKEKKNLQLDQRWRDAFCDIKPSVFEIRKTYENEWIRVHNFSEKRLPESESDERELIRLHNKILSMCFLDDDDITIFWGQREIDGQLEPVPRSLKNVVDLEVLEYFSFESTEGIELILGGQVQWDAAKLRDLILDVSYWRTDGVVLANLARGFIYAPYDGGIDLFVLNPTLLGKLRRALDS